MPTKAVGETKEKPKDKHLAFIDRERELLKTRTEKDTGEARMLMATDPVRSHLLALVDELIRQGIYLSKEEQEGAKFFVKIIGREIQKGDILANVKKKK